MQEGPDRGAFLVAWRDQYRCTGAPGERMR